MAHSCPVFLEAGDWKVARTRRLESLRYDSRRGVHFGVRVDYQPGQQKNPFLRTGWVIDCYEVIYFAPAFLAFLGLASASGLASTGASAAAGRSTNSRMASCEASPMR